MGAGVVGKYYKATFTLENITAGGIRLICSNSGGIARYSPGTYTEFIGPISSGGTLAYFQAQGTTTATIDNVSIQEVGWSGASDLYAGLIAQGYTAYNATKACAMWCHYNNDPANGVIYGKLYNWYAVKLLQDDIDAYNAANPTTPYGWHVPTQAEFTTLQTYLGGASVAGGKLKMTGTSYWSSPNTGADNSSGFSAVGAGRRYDTGVFGELLANSFYWSVTESSSSAYRVSLFSVDATMTISLYDKKGGLPIRFIKD
jgi:uncharacterized protein (TIGR02145 family)